MENKPILIFHTSGIDRLADDVGHEALIQGLRSGFFLRFTFTSIVAYAVFFWLAAHLFVIAYEEPTLRKSFGAEYETFCAHVPRWTPRFSPWREGTRG